MEKLRSLFHRPQSANNRDFTVAENLEEAIDLMMKPKSVHDPVEIFIEERKRDDATLDFYDDILPGEY